MESMSAGRKLSKSASGLRMIPVSDTFACPFALPEPMWISDKEVCNCETCKKPFDFFKRKHHCRRCGLCFCDHCCHHVIPLKRMYFVDPVRHCYDCAVISKAETDFYDKAIKTLIAGSDFSVYNHNTDSLIGKYKCHLTNDNRYIRHHAFKSSTCGNDPPMVLLSKIVEAKFATSPTNDDPEQKIPTGFTVKFKDENDSFIVHQLRFTSINRGETISWLTSLQKAIKMLFETRELNSMDE